MKISQQPRTVADLLVHAFQLPSMATSTPIESGPPQTFCYSLDDVSPELAEYVLCLRLGEGHRYDAYRHASPLREQKLRVTTALHPPSRLIPHVHIGEALLTAQLGGDGPAISIHRRQPGRSIEQWHQHNRTMFPEAPNFHTGLELMETILKPFDGRSPQRDANPFIPMFEAMYQVLRARQYPDVNNRGNIMVTEDGRIGLVDQTGWMEHPEQSWAAREYSLEKAGEMALNHIAGQGKQGVADAEARFVSEPLRKRYRECFERVSALVGEARETVLARHPEGHETDFCFARTSHIHAIALNEKFSDPVRALREKLEEIEAPIGYRAALR